MEKIIKQLEKIITNIEGNIICIGLNDKHLINTIRKNTKIVYCDLLNNHVFSKSKNKGKKQGKTREKR